MNYLLMYKTITLCTIFFALNSCQTQQGSISISKNPAAQDFNADASDAKAIAIADEVMQVMGGRKAWDDAQYLSWTFFGNRKHIWDKKNKRCRIESPRQDLTILLNLEDNSGSAKRGDHIYSQQDSLNHFLEMGKRWWINDSYWLVMPYKFKDSGVTLKYSGKGTTEEGRSSDVLELTFEEVGVTPDNKYLVYVDDNSRLVTQWDYYTNYQDSLPRFKSPWSQYQRYGELLLSGGTLGERKLTDITVDAPSATVFTEF